MSPVLRFKSFLLTAVTAVTVLLAVLLTGVVPHSAARAQEPSPKLTIFAAASLKGALDEVVAKLGSTHGISARIAYAASSTLAKQIGEGAPADLFMSADLEWMDHLEKTGAIVSGTRRNLLGNTLVLIAPKDSTVALRIAPGFAIADVLGGERLAVTETVSAPAGRYAKAALTHFGVWEAVAPKLAQTATVRAALALVARGEAPLGIVYATDAAAEPAVRIVATFPASSHPPILYPVAVVKDAPHAVEAGKLLGLLDGAEAQTILTRHGFSVLACGSDCVTAN